jgi:hypothetical protein
LNDDQKVVRYVPVQIPAVGGDELLSDGEAPIYYWLAIYNMGQLEKNHRAAREAMGKEIAHTEQRVSPLVTTQPWNIKIEDNLAADEVFRFGQENCRDVGRDNRSKLGNIGKDHGEVMLGIIAEALKDPQRYLFGPIR